MEQWMEQYHCGGLLRRTSGLVVRHVVDGWLFGCLALVAC
jgi:hypothetical protein